MDKSFNDQELSDIMKEIEALEADYDSFDKTQMESTEASNASLAPVEESDVLKDLTTLGIEKSVPKTNIYSFGTQDSSTKATQKSSMSFKVQGDITLELALEIAGKSIVLDVTESGLTIIMENGVTFKVPMNESAPLKKAV